MRRCIRATRQTDFALCAPTHVMECTMLNTSSKDTLSSSAGTSIWHVPQWGDHVAGQEKVFTLLFMCPTTACSVCASAECGRRDAQQRRRLCWSILLFWLSKIVCVYLERQRRFSSKKSEVRISTLKRRKCHWEEAAAAAQYGISWYCCERNKKQSFEYEWGTCIQEKGV